MPGVSGDAVHLTVAAAASLICSGGKIWASNPKLTRLVNRGCESVSSILVAARGRR